ncbi:MAG TPA: nitrilase-related carbon-nitrogen hydrolase [Pirellulales bacterium]|nr:nitrilase-related carbon-nitrogen hydrolase [Pirellulales bacterium]
MRVACIQLELTDEPKSATVARVEACLDETRGCDLVLLPELWPCGYFAFDRYEAEAEAIDGPLMGRLAKKAAQLGAYLLTGSFVERDGQRLYNTCVLLDRKGQQVARYRKQHLFGYRSQESLLLSPGSETVVALSAWGPIGLSICYDLRFPELYRRMIDQQARIMLVTASWPAARHEAWNTLCRARAIENLAIVIACNAAGSSAGARLAGNSMAVGPMGELLAQADEGGCILQFEVDPTEVERARNDFPALNDRKLR